MAPPRPPLPGGDIPPPRPPPPETDDEEEMFMHAPQPNQPIMVREMTYSCDSTHIIIRKYKFLNKLNNIFTAKHFCADGRSWFASRGETVVEQGQ